MEEPKTASDQIAVPKTVLKQMFDRHDELLTEVEPNNLGGFDTEDCEFCGSETVHVYDPKGTGHGICLHCYE